MKRYRSGWALLVCTMILAACGDRSAEPTETEEDEEETPPIPVETSLPVRGDIYAFYAGTAPIEAFAEADVIVERELKRLSCTELLRIIDNIIDQSLA